MDLLPAPIAEVVPAALRVVSQPSLFRAPATRITKTIPHGATLLELVLGAGMGVLRDGVVHLPGRVLVTIDGEEVPRYMWHLVKPKSGHIVNVYLVPQNQRQTILIGATLAIGVAAFYTGGLGAGAAGPV
jgi:hypothetical protein